MNELYLIVNISLAKSNMDTTNIINSVYDTDVSFNTIINNSPTSVMKNTSNEDVERGIDEKSVRPANKSSKITPIEIKWREFNSIKHHLLRDLKCYAKFLRIPYSKYKKNEILLRVKFHIAADFLSSSLSKIGKTKMLQRCISSLTEFKDASKPITNDKDFYSFDDLQNVPKHMLFVLYENGHNYGFDLESIYQLILHSKQGEPILNPFTRVELSSEVVNSVLRIGRIYRMINIPEFTIEDNEDTLGVIHEPLSNEGETENLFMEIDRLGNYSQSHWFLSLNRQSLFRFVVELKDLFEYRSQMPISTRMRLIPNYGSPYYDIIMPVLSRESYDQIHAAANLVMRRMLYSADDESDRCLCATYILTALTLVSYEAATALPWLYESVANIY